MTVFKKIRRKRITENIQPVHFERIYQYSSGEYLPDSSQPDCDKNYEITSGKYTPRQSVRYTDITIGGSGLPQSQGKDTDKKLPKLYSKREDCCGCTACYSVCPVNAIYMRPDEEGFDYPVISADKCVRCYRCCDVCPIK